MLKLHPPIVLSIVIALAGTGAAVAVATRTDGGIAPANGEMTFDSPGCLPAVYDGPGRSSRYDRSRPCPAPTAVILSHATRTPHGWLVALDGSRSYDRTGARIASYRWTIRPGDIRRGPRITVRYRHAGVHTILLAVIDSNGTGGESDAVLNLP